MKTAPVSVVIPLFNGRRFIVEAIESILSQELRAQETVVVDDGSTDGGYSLCLAYPGVRLFRQPNGGVRLYYGAYTNPEQAALAVPAVRAAGIRPLLVYRIGRVF